MVPPAFVGLSAVEMFQRKYVLLPRDFRFVPVEAFQ
jgi:hypothetical protein